MSVLFAYLCGLVVSVVFWYELPEVFPWLILASVFVSIWSIISYIRALRLYINASEKFSQTARGAEAENNVFLKKRYPSIPKALLFELLIDLNPICNIGVFVIEACLLISKAPNNFMVWYENSVEQARWKSQLRK